MNTSSLFLEENFKFMEVNVNFPAFHGRLDASAAIVRLRTVDRPGAYLVRYKKDFIISYINLTGDIKHMIVRNDKNSSLRKENPGLVTTKATVDFLTSIDLQRYAYLVSWRDFDEPIVLPNTQDEGYSCHCCDKSFKEQKELLIHISIHKESFCPTCRSMVPYRSFSNHKQKCQGKPKHLHCHICTFSTSYRHSLNQHIKTRHGNTSGQCTYCDKHFRNASCLENHMQSHTGYDCSFCGRNFKTKYGRDRHVKANHTDTDDEDDVQPQASGGPFQEDQLPPTTPPAHPQPDASPRQPYSLLGCLSDRDHRPGDAGDPGGISPSSPMSPAHASQPQPDFCDHDHGPGDPSQPSSPIHFGPQHLPPEFAPAAQSTPKRGFFRCHLCSFKAHSKKLLRRHIRTRHNRPPPLFACNYCKNSKAPFVTKDKRNLKDHKKVCLGVPRVPVVLDQAELWDIVSQVGISNRSAEKLLTGLCQKLGYRFVPKHLRKCLSDSLNSFRRFVTCETLSFKTKSGEDADPTTLVYVQDLRSVIDQVIASRNIKSPFINIGIDGGRDKVIVVLQVVHYN